MGTYIYLLIEHRTTHVGPVSGLRVSEWDLVSLKYPCPHCTPEKRCHFGHEQSGGQCIGYDTAKDYVIHALLSGDRDVDFVDRDDHSHVIPAPPWHERGLPDDLGTMARAVAHEDVYGWEQWRHDAFDAEYGHTSLGNSDGRSWLSLRELLGYDFKKNAAQSEEFVLFLEQLRALFPSEQDLDDTRIVFGFA